MLTREDLNGIKGVVTDALENSFPRLFEKSFTPFAQAIQKDFSKVHERFEKIDERFNKVDERFEKIDERFDKIDERFSKVDGDINYIHNHLSLIEGKIDKKADQETVRSLQGRVAGLETTVTNIE